MKHDYTALDGQLLAAIKSGKRFSGDITCTEVMQEASARATKIIEERENKLVDTFKEKGINVVTVDKSDFEKTVLEKVTFEEFGYDKADWEAIRAVK